MTNSKQTKYLVYALIMFLFSSNQAVLASSMFHRHQHETRTSTSLHNLQNQIHDNLRNQLQNKDQMVDSHFISVKDHDHKKHIGCNGGDHCNHCVNLLSSMNITNANTIKLPPVLGVFASYYDLTLPSDYRPPRHA